MRGRARDDVNFQRLTDDSGGRKILPWVLVAPVSDEIRIRSFEFLLTGPKPALAEGSKSLPNYGKSVGMRPAEWWGRVSISPSYSPLLHPPVFYFVVLSHSHSMLSFLAILHNI